MDQKCDKTFLKIKEKLESAKALVHFDPSLSIVLATDASSVSIGAVDISYCY